MKNGLNVFLVVTLLAITTPLVATAGGNIRPGGSLSPKALGLAGAHNAISGDGAAFYHNIANISQVPDFLELNLDLIVAQAHFREHGNDRDENSELELFPMPMLALSHRLNDRLTLGFAVYPNDGIGVEYRDQKYQKSFMASINATSAIAWQATDKLTIGIGIDVVYGKVTENAIFDQFGFPVKEIFLKNRADGWGLGYRLGLRFEPFDWLTFGISYASRRKVEMDCQSDISILDLSLGQIRGQTSIVFPGRLGFGVAVRPTENWMLACDFNWYDYSKLDEIKFDFDWFSITQNMGWKNNTSLHLGAEKTINDRWKLRFGLACLWPAIPEEKTVSILPDGMGYCGSVGLGWKNRQGNLALDMAIFYGHISRKTSPGPEILSPGRNEIDVGIMSAGITYYFGKKK